VTVKAKPMLKLFVVAGVGLGLLGAGVIVGGAAAGSSSKRGGASPAPTAMVCSACHGQAGQSPSDTMPILAGMDPAYFKKAIADYAAGRRPSPEMEPYAKMTAHFGVDEIAAYFAAQPRRGTQIKVDAAAAARGKAAAAECAVCHGAHGVGDPAKVVPALAGQPPGYLRAQLQLFKHDQRSPGDPALRRQKTLIQAIPDDTLADLAAYYASLR
jgi:cytochrome c553